MIEYFGLMWDNCKRFYILIFVDWRVWGDWGSGFKVWGKEFFC